MADTDIEINAEVSGILIIECLSIKRESVTLGFKLEFGNNVHQDLGSNTLHIGHTARIEDAKIIVPMKYKSNGFKFGGNHG